MNNLEEENIMTSSNKLDTPETIIGSSVNVEGELKSDGDIRVEGNVTGSIKTKHNLSIGANAVIEASIAAQNAVISGTVNGNITTSERLELADSARVTGDLSSKVLVIAAGAVFTGSSKMETAGESTGDSVKTKSADAKDKNGHVAELNSKIRRGRRSKI